MVAALFVAAAASAQAPDPEVVQAIDVIVTAKDHGERTAAYSKILTKVSARDLPALAKGFERITTATGATYQLPYLTERIKTPQALALLHQQLDHPVVNIRLYVAYALDRLQDRTWVDKLLAALADESLNEVQRASLVSAFRNKEDALIDQLAAVAGRKGVHEYVVARILSTLADPPRARFEQLFRAKAAKGQPPKVRGAAMTGLLALGHEEVLDDLWAAYDGGELSDSDLQQSLLYLKTKLTKRMMQFIRDVLDRAESTSLITRLCQMLGAAGDRQAVPILKRLARHENSAVKNAAMDALASIAAPDLVEWWKERLGDLDVRTQVKAAKALLQIDDRSGMEQLVAAAVDPNLVVRREAIQLLGQYPDRTAMDALITALDDKDSILRGYAWTAVGATIRAFFPYHGVDLNALGWIQNGPAAGRRAVQGKLRTWWAKRNR